MNQASTVERESLHAVSANDGAHGVTRPTRVSPGRNAWRRFKRNRAAVASAWFLIILIAAIAAWPVVLKISGAHFAQLHDPDQLSDAQFAPPSAQHWFGTDVHGRDLFSRCLSGAQISLLVGVVGALVSLIIGVLWGAVAGYAGGRADSDFDAHRGRAVFAADNHFCHRPPHHARRIAETIALRRRFAGARQKPCA